MKPLHFPQLLTLLGLMLWAGTSADVRADGRLSPRLPEWNQLNEYRPWTGKNGRVLTAKFMHRKDDTLFLMIRGREAPTPVNINGLSSTTRLWFERCIKQRDAERIRRDKRRAMQAAEKKAPGGPTSLKLRPGQVVEVSADKKVEVAGRSEVPHDQVTRRNVPNFNQADYGKKASDCVPNSYAMFISWWHTSGWVKMPESRKAADKQVDWLHDRLSRRMKTRNNSGTRASRLAENMQQFFREEMHTPVAFTHRFDYDYSPENLAKYTQGANATVLYVTTYSGRKKQGGHAVTLKIAKPDGSIEFNTWGMSLTGKIKRIPGEESMSYELRKKIPSYEIELDVGTRLPEWFIDQEQRFVLEASEYDCISVLTPYLPDSADGK
ncbi:hypothetical protein JO972_14605 [Verrucomicrobiaceae bacterium 5K15]|uniref:Peptidase C39-like domain-containing protein n=1 Tax=Oceaniferula flava TaxID=2800421 RepID=A0AAE2VES7_9BACT|nr:hypothetical protein [Oceaniferula flavus]MBK1856199.1 hypothetical protein [Oceaniferula flavus]MBM1137506.1 hypothetical protein [Oceaniferula flavus]